MFYYLKVAKVFLNLHLLLPKEIYDDMNGDVEGCADHKELQPDVDHLNIFYLICYLGLGRIVIFSYPSDNG